MSAAPETTALPLQAVGLMPRVARAGIGVSRPAIENVQDFVQVADAKDLPLDDNSFYLVVSVNSVHNLPFEECKKSIRETEQFSENNSFVTMDAYRSESEHEAKLKRNHMALNHLDVNDREVLLAGVGYTGDYYWFIAESA